MRCVLPRSYPVRALLCSARTQPALAESYTGCVEHLQKTTFLSLAMGCANSLVAAVQDTPYMQMLLCARRQLTSSGGPYGHCLTIAMTFFWAWHSSWAGYLRITLRCPASKQPVEFMSPSLVALGSGVPM